MFSLCIQSYQRYLTWWFSSFKQSQRKIAPLGLARLGFLCVLFPLFLLLQTIHWIGFFIDEICFRDYRRIRVESPVFITGIPRSGTTFLHRTLAADHAQFTSVSTWEALLAPSITERRCIHALQWVDAKLGHIFGRCLRACIKLCSGKMEDIHEIDLAAPEEDYLCLLPYASCFILYLAFPQAEWLRGMATLQTLPKEQVDRTLQTYKRILQKHMYLAPKGKRLLSKNAAFASWTPELIKHFPDARIVLCIRDPKSGLSSQLSSLAPARAAFGTDPMGTHTTAAFTQIFEHNYKLLAAQMEAASEERLVILDQSDMEQAPADVITKALHRLEISPSELLQAEVSQLRPRTKSPHQHSAEAQGIDLNQVKICLDPAYQAMLQSSLRIRPKNIP